MSANDKWTITGDEKKMYDQQFDQLGPAGGFLRGDQVRSHFMKSNLGGTTLGQIWQLSDITMDGKMDKFEFAIAMKLIKLKLHGTMLPTALPPSMKKQPVKFDISSFAQTSLGNSTSKEEFSLLASMSNLPKSTTPIHSGNFTNSQPTNTMSGLSSASAPNLMSGFGNAAPLMGGVPGMTNSLGRNTMPSNMGAGLMGTNTLPGLGSTGALQLNSMQGLGNMAPVGIASPQLYGMPPAQPMGMMNPPLSSTPVNNSLVQAPAPSGGSPPTDWAVPKQTKLKYNQVFNSNDTGKIGFISGMAARHLLKRTGLPDPILAQIWNVSDIDKDGKLTQEEFVLAMHLTDIARSGAPVPVVLPPELIPPSYRRNAIINSGPNLQNDSSNLTSLDNLSIQDKTSTSFATFEDRRRDNFNKGNIELEKRRLALLEEQRKEQERLERKEREQREKRERERREQEMRRQAELERQIEMQQAAEREREEARRKAVEQREAAQRELERQTRLEFERVKRQELLQQKLREQEAVTSLHAKTKELDIEITTLKEKKDQLEIRVSDLASREKEQRAALDTMDQSRNMKSTAVTLRQNELKDLNNKLDRMVPEKQDLLARIRDTNDNSAGESGFLKSNFEARKKTVLELQTAVDKNQSDSATKMIEFKKLNIQLNDLREELNRHQLKVEAMNRVQQDKVRELQEARRAKEASLMRKDSTEKMKRNKHANVIQKGIMVEKQNQIKSELQNIFDKKDTKSKTSQPFGTSNFGSDDNGSDLFGKTDAFATSDNVAAFGGNSHSDAFGVSSASGDMFGSNADPFGSESDPFSQNNGFQSAPTMTEEEIKRENVKKKIAEMQQKRLEQKRLQQDAASVQVQKSSSLPKTISQENLSKFRALYDFSSRNNDELTLKAGDIVMVNEKEDIEPGWFSGLLNGKKGLFPANYVEKVTGTPEQKPAKGLEVPPAKPLPVQQPVINNSNSMEEVHQKGKSAFIATHPGRRIDSSPIPGQGIKISLRCQALYPWKAKKENHLTFEPDTIIDVTEQQSMWWFGSCNGKSGWFPKSYVRELSSDGQTVAKTPEPVKINEPAPISSNKGKEYIASYPFTSEEDGDLNFAAGEVICVTESDGDWWKGSIGNRTGIFPANYVAPKPETTNAVATNSSTTTTTSSTSSTREIADVIAVFNGASPNQLSLKPGQLVLVKKKSDTGWWEGELQARGKKKQVGWFPADYVKIRTPNQPKPKVVCQVMAMFDYIAQNDDEISFPRGMKINVIDKTDADWWKGSTEEVPNRYGLFPSNYIREMTQNDTWVAEQQAMNPNEIRRQQHIHELIASEESYLKDLEMANAGFQVPLKKRKILTDQEMSTLFANWDELIVCSAKLVNAFRVRKKHSGDGGPGAVVSQIGDVLCQQLPHLQPYIRFCSCQLNASSLLQQKIDNDPEFKKFVKQCESGNKFRGLPVSSYLVKPMQRITKYPLLIEKILKYTPEDHADHGHLVLALERAEEICFNVNEGVRQKENADRLEWLQSHINMDPLDKLVFNSATNCLGQRRFLHCGTLYKHKSNKELVGFLFNDFLLLTTPAKPLNSPVNDFIFSSKTTNFQFRMYKMPIFLNEILIRLPTDPSPPGGNDSADEDLALFHVSHVDRVYILRAENVNERTAWTSKIKQASQLYLETEKKKREKAYHARSQRTSGIGRLMVVIVEGCNLVKGSNGRSDPYCEVNMGAQSHTTKTLQDTSNPKWGTNMQFFIKDISEDVLCISVFQRDMFSPDDFLGRTELKVADIQKSMRKSKGPLTKKLLLHEVQYGEVVVKVDLQLFEATGD